MMSEATSPSPTSPSPSPTSSSPGVAKKFMLLHRRAPHGGCYAQEGLEVALIGAAFEQEVTLAFIDDGVFQLKTEQDATAIDMKNFTAAFAALDDYDVRRIYVEAESLATRGLTADDLMPVMVDGDDGDEKPLIEIITADKLARIIEMQDVLLNF